MADPKMNVTGQAPMGGKRNVRFCITGLALVSATALFVFVAGDGARDRDSHQSRLPEADGPPAESKPVPRVPVVSDPSNAEDIGSGDDLLEADASPAHSYSGAERLQQIRDEFIAETEPKDLDLHDTSSERNSIFQFYLSQLRSSDKEIRDAAFDVFAAAYGDPSFTATRGRPKEIGEDHDLRKLSGMLIATWETAKQLGAAKYAPEDSGINVLWGNRGFFDLAELVIPYLDDPERAELASAILNSLTASTYEDRDSEWWKNDFANSSFAGLLQGVPARDWKSRPE